VIGLSIVLVFTGLLYPTQACVNRRINQRFAVKTTGSLISFGVGLTVLGVFNALMFIANRSASGFQGLAERAAESGEWYHVTGGIFGVLFVTGGMILSPLLGISTYMSCVISGQLSFSLVLDGIGAFGLTHRPPDGLRVLGVFVAVLGAFIIRRESQSSTAITATSSSVSSQRRRYDHLTDDDWGFDEGIIHDLDASEKDDEEVEVELVHQQHQLRLATSTVLI
jgi:transporter family-2 protein